MKLENLKIPFPVNKSGPKPTPAIIRFNNKWEPVTESGCWIWTGAVTGNGYGAFWISGRYDGAHRAAYTLYNGGIPKNKVVCHSCDNPLCVNPSHLFLGSVINNNKDRDEKGRTASMERNSGAKLSRDEALKVKYSTLPITELADTFKINRSQVWRIKTGRAWSNL